MFCLTVRGKVFGYVKLLCDRFARRRRRRADSAYFIKGQPLNIASIRPKSATDFGVSMIALGVALGLTWAVAPWHALGLLRAWVPYVPIIPCLGIALVLAVSQWLGSATRSANTGAASIAPRTLQLQRVAARLCGVVSTFALIALIYWVLPEYHGDFYQPFWAFLRTLAPLALLIPVYLVWADRHVDSADDEYLEFGKLFLSGRHHVDFSLIRRHLLGWLVKAFFLPLMTVYFSRELVAFYAALEESSGGTVHRYQILFHLSYMIDLLFAVVGYTVSMRLFDTHIRSVEPTVGGWVVALMCYQPFVSATGNAYMVYDDKIYWDNFLQPWPVVQMCWGVLIVCLLFVYCLSTVAFGLRFSNLTHRGIITDGPYRFTKHPAYLAKNLSWWLISVPMLSDAGWPTAVRNCCVLGLVNLVYYARARTEENHLSRDPTYIAYAVWIEEHGLLAPMSKWFPFMRYRSADRLALEKTSL